MSYLRAGAALAGLGAICLLAAGRSSAPGQSASFNTKLDKDKLILHALNRLTFGPQPGDVERIRSIGLKKWIAAQLHPEQMGENPELEAKLQPLETISMTPDEIGERYPSPALIRQIIGGKRELPSEPLARAAAENLIRQYEAKRAAKNRSAEADGDNTAQASADADSAAAAGAQTLGRYLDAGQIQMLRGGLPADKAALLASLEPNPQFDSMLIAMPRGMRLKLTAAAAAPVRRKLMLLDFPLRPVVYDLWEAKTYRAIYSDRQLEEVLDDFWFNHFNVFLDKGQERKMLAEYEREAIRPHVLGKFRDLLEATAKSPAMLFYLDNWESAGPHSFAAERASRADSKKKKPGLNENYGRELLELHTLGVNGGYTQKDVIEVARCFSGWTIQQPYIGGSFLFRPRMHDLGTKMVLGHKITAGGMEDGEQVLDILAREPATAHHISYELAQRFVADNPPDALVDRMARTFLSTGGDLRAVMETMLESPEFWSEGAYLAKVKTPFEMAVSAARALDADVDDAYALTNRIAALGEPLYRKQEPAGYSNMGADWMNSAALLARLNFSLALSRSKIPGVQVDLTRFAVSDEGGAERMARTLLMREPSAATLDGLGQAQTSGNADAAYLAGLVIGSPDFQRH